jgi:ABC-2 type transport system ATP-binding protein
MITLNNLTKKYGEQIVVNDVSFEVKAGEILGFLGPNGAGKTTTMRMLTCYLPPTSGTATVDGLDIHEDSMKIRNKIGYLPEDNPLYLDMNVVDYLKFAAKLHGVPQHKMKERLERVIETCGLRREFHKDIGELSKGYRQRVGLAQAMIHDPKYLILDEPTTGLDPNQIIEIRHLIKELGKEKTVILSTHIMQEVQASCDRVLIINRGNIVADGTPEELQSTFKGKETFHLELKLPDHQKFEDILWSKFPQLTSVDSVMLSDDENIWHINLETEKDIDLREDIFKLAVEKGWIILEMHREHVSLEHVFIELTQNQMIEQAA